MILAGFRAMELISTRLEYKCILLHSALFSAKELISTRLEYKCTPFLQSTFFSVEINKYQIGI